LALPPQVHSQVLVQVGFLGEALITTVLLALERALTGVDSKVVKEVVPFSEEHVAPTVVTFQKLHISLGPWVFVFENTKLSGMRYLFINFD
jgi:hypothetical protein